MYGLVKQFIRVLCPCVNVYDYAVVTWFPPPEYPDRDPLTVRISLGGSDPNSFIGNVRVVSLKDIAPSRVLVEIVLSESMYMMRKEGLDTNLIFN